MSLNQCGECTLCCEILPIPEINKPENQLCPNCTEKSGCNIYSNRPISCRQFDCVYIKNDDSEDLRPDKTGIIFEYISENIIIGTRRESKIYDWETKKINDYIDTLNENGISVILTSFTNAPLIVKPTNGKTVIDILRESAEIYNKEFKK